MKGRAPEDENVTWDCVWQYWFDDCCPIHDATTFCGYKTSDSSPCDMQYPNLRGCPR